MLFVIFWYIIMFKKYKKNFVCKIKKKLNKSLSIILLNFHGLSTNKLNLFRSDVKSTSSSMMVIRNNLLKISLYKSSLSYLNNYLVGPIILIFSTENYGSLFKILVKYLNKYKNNLVLKSISIDKKNISLSLKDKLSFLYSIKECLKYLIFILKDFFLFRLLRVFLFLKNVKC